NRRSFSRREITSSSLRSRSRTASGLRTTRSLLRAAAGRAPLLFQKWLEVPVASPRARDELEDSKPTAPCPSPLRQRPCSANRSQLRDVEPVQCASSRGNAPFEFEAQNSANEAAAGSATCTNRAGSRARTSRARALSTRAAVERAPRLPEPIPLPPMLDRIGPAE